jgi:multiple sugar transport system permease protein
VKQRVLETIGLLLVAAYSAAPFLWQIITSLKPTVELGSLPPLLPGRISLEQYAAVLADQSLLRMALNSALVAAATTVLALGLGALAAFAVSVLRVRGRQPILAVVLAVSMFPSIALVSPLFLAVNAVGLRDTLLALIITYTTFSLPLAIWLLTSFFDRLPREIYQAARVDGCTPAQALIHVVLPLAVPALTAAGLVVFIFSWNEFLLALTLTSTDASRTVPVGIAMFPGLHEIPYGEIAAAAVLVTLPLAVLAFVFQRRVIEGLTAGAIKG